MSKPTTWIVTDGGAGFEVQALGVAEAMGVEPVIKRVKQSAPWRWLAPWGPAVDRDDVEPPWPDLVIAAGRQSIPFARMIRRRARGKAFVAVLQDPRVPASAFDFVWVPAHDRLRGPNVFTTTVSPHRLTLTRLAEEARRVATDIAHLPHPRTAVLLGGPNSVFRFDEAAAERIARSVVLAAKDSGGGLMVTPSRRTDPRVAEIFARWIKEVPSVMWDGKDDNPYFGFLGAAEAILVTCDSVNMVGEAAATGKPVHVIELEGGSPKWDRFLGSLYVYGAARPFKGKIENWRYTPMNPTQDIATAILRAMEKKALESENRPLSFHPS